MSHRISRADRRAGSNNAANPNRNVCALAAARAFGVGDVQRYLHTDSDLFRAIRSKYSVRSVKSSCASTVGAARADMARLATERRDLIAFVVIVQGHVLVINRDGQTIVDTAPRQRDRRAIRRIMGVYRQSIFN